LSHVFYYLIIRAFISILL